ncbi:alpha/beta fold hydrolase [Thermocoleostomius sinensis]|uniref:Alpha/beta hydrolase n=1 Tax=Thermocoleostomius sinensis A174 TaxID=2016057 RepID=A0A9E9C5U5_9CYAN|nr:alpha/beta hydrolase [Thermocoleostomius sinensis]WAL61546.1 alpha/beta hydrolase [Thermocoleostomius sinensis A174]
MTDVVEYPYFRTPRPTNPNAPLFIYLPGMDGTGLLLDRQLAGLEKGFDIRCLSISLNDLSSWEVLTEQVVNLVRVELQRELQQSVYLCGESFGGCLALKVITRAPELFKRFVLINPASSFQRFPWMYWGSLLVQPFPEPIHRLSCLSFLPFLAALNRITPDNRRALLDAMISVSQETSVWRLSLLREFQIGEAELRQITQPTLVIASGSDRLLPSILEADRLVQLMPNARKHVLPYSGHACLLEADIDLYEIMQSEGFLPERQPELEESIVSG